MFKIWFSKWISHWASLLEGLVGVVTFCIIDLNTLSLRAIGWWLDVKQEYALKRRK